MAEKTNLVIVPEKIHLVKVMTNNFFIDDAVSNTEDIDIKMGQKTMHNLQNSTVKITLSIDLSTQGRNVANFLNDSFFYIENLSDYIVNDSKKVEFNGSFIATLISIAYSTLRGILLEKCKDTVLKDFSLPIINPNKLLHTKMEV